MGLWVYCCPRMTPCLWVAIQIIYKVFGGPCLKQVQEAAWNYIGINLTHAGSLRHVAHDDLWRANPSKRHNGLPRGHAFKFWPAARGVGEEVRSCMG
eukprot:2905101-Pyramimonas_sp.AAC.1